MLIGDRLRAIREEKKLSQGDIEKRTGLLRCYVSRVENGHTVPAVETIEKFARALEVPIYQLFYDGEQTSRASKPSQEKDRSGHRVGCHRQRCSLSDKVAPSLSQGSRTGQKAPALHGPKNCNPQRRARSQPGSVLTATRHHGRGSMTTLPSSSGHSQGITSILEIVIAVASNPSPPDLVPRRQLIQLTPQILVLHRLSV